MDQYHFKPLNLHAPKGTCTAMDWCVGGMQTSVDQNSSYTISVFKHWYVYRRKPSWFGQYAHDRYLGRLRWISHHADGKQWRNAGQRGDLDGVKVLGPVSTKTLSTDTESSEIAKHLILAHGYLKPFHSYHMREPSQVTRNYYRGIRCACCGTTQAETQRKRDKMAWSMAYPDLRIWLSCGEITYSDARARTRQEVTCNCLLQG